jgi:hypothetical protein
MAVHSGASIREKFLSYILHLTVKVEDHLIFPDVVADTSPTRVHLPSPESLTLSRSGSQGGISIPRDRARPRPIDVQ